MGIEGEEDDGLFEGIVRDMKARDRKAFEDSIEVAIMILWIWLLSIFKGAKVPWKGAGLGRSY